MGSGAGADGPKSVSAGPEGIKWPPKTLQEFKEVFRRVEGAGDPWDTRPAIDPIDIVSGGIAAIARSGVKSIAAKEITTYLYQKLGAAGEHLKFGITKNPATRYTAEQLAGGKLNVIAEGAKKNMLQLERNLHETLPVGSQEGQKFYIHATSLRSITP